MAVKRGREKATAHAAVQDRLWAHRGVQITVLDPEVTSGGNLRVVVVEARYRGEQLPLDNPYVFVNPPLQVPDGTEILEDVVPVIDDAPVPELAHKVRRKGYREDPAAAFRQIVGEAVLARARQMGWSE